MKTAADLEAAFSLYLTEIESCEKRGCWWALLHLLVAMPDICAALDGKPQGPKRYLDWCDENFPGDPVMTPTDRYQMRCALLHEGTTQPAVGKSQYTVFSFVDPRMTAQLIHQLVEADTIRGGAMCTVNIKGLADDTRGAMQNWFGLVAGNATRNATVETNLKRLAMTKPKVMTIKVPGGTPISIRTTTQSSS